MLAFDGGRHDVVEGGLHAVEPQLAHVNRPGIFGGSNLEVDVACGCVGTGMVNMVGYAPFWSAVGRLCPDFFQLIER